MDKTLIEAAYKEHQALKKISPFDDVSEAIKSSTNAEFISSELRSFLGRCVDFTLKRFWTLFFGEVFGTIENISERRFFNQAMSMSQNLGNDTIVYSFARDRNTKVYDYLTDDTIVAKPALGSPKSIPEKKAFSLVTFRKFVDPFYAAKFVDEPLRNQLSGHPQNDGYDGDDCSEIFYGIAHKWSGQPVPDFYAKWKDTVDESYPSWDKNVVIAVKELHRRHFVYGLLDMPENIYLCAVTETSKRAGTIHVEIFNLATELYCIAARAAEPSLIGQLEALYGTLEIGDGQEDEEEGEKEEQEEKKDEDNEEKEAWNVQRTPFTEEPVQQEEDEEEMEDEPIDLSVYVDTVTLNLDTENPFLGIAVVGQRSVHRDDGIYVAAVAKGSVVALDGRIEVGDMIVQVNETSFDNLSNDEAVDMLSQTIKKQGTIRITVAKSINSIVAKSINSIVAKSIDSPLRSALTVPNASIRDEDEEDMEGVEDGDAWRVQGTPEGFTIEPLQEEEEEEEKEDSDEEEEEEEDEDSEDEDDDDFDRDLNWRYPEEGIIQAKQSLLDEPLDQVEKRKIGAEILGLLEGIKEKIGEIESRSAKTATDLKDQQKDARKHGWHAIVMHIVIACIGFVLDYRLSCIMVVVFVMMFAGEGCKEDEEDDDDDYSDSDSHSDSDDDDDEDDE